VDHLLVEIAALKTALAEREAALAERDAALAERDAEVAELNRRLAEVERVLNRNSSNSSKPPSSDKPGAKKRKKKQSGKKPGGLVTRARRARLFRPSMSTSSWCIRSLARAASVATTASSNSRLVDVIRCSSFPRFAPRSPSTS